MIYLLTGVPGNGKTLYAVDFIDKALKKGREVYSDIKGLKLEGVKPAPEDWRTVPDGSLIVYDEAHKRFPSYRGKGRSPLAVVRDMDEHRHRGIDMMMVTQWPNKIDGELFHLVGTHQHLNRAMGLQRAHLTTFSRAVMNPYSLLSRKGADETIWEFPKQHYNSYASSSMHTDAHKFKLPAKVRNALISIPLIVATLWGVYKIITPSAPAKGPEEERSGAEPTTKAPSAVSMLAPGISTSAMPAVPPTGEYASISAPPVPSLAGCIDSDRGCRCWNTDGLLIDQSQAECRLIVDKPFPMNIYHPYSRSEVVTAEKPGREAQGNPVTMSLPGNLTEVGETSNVVSAPEPHF